MRRALAIICLSAILWFSGAVGAVYGSEPESALPSGYSKYNELDLSKPWFVALHTWHRAIIARDYDAYLASITRDPGIDRSEQEIRDKYDTLVLFTPETIKVGPVENLPNGNVEFSVVGCKSGYRYIADAIAEKEGDSWRILISGWSLPWNSRRPRWHSHEEGQGHDPLGQRGARCRRQGAAV